MRIELTLAILMHTKKLAEKFYHIFSQIFIVGNIFWGSQTQRYDGHKHEIFRITSLIRYRKLKKKF